MDILGVIMCVVGVIGIFVAIWFFICAAADEDLKYLIIGLVIIITGLVLICYGSFLDGYIKGTVVDIMSDKIIIMDDDDTTWEYRVNKYITQKYKIGDTIEIYNDDNVNLLK